MKRYDLVEKMTYGDDGTTSRGFPTIFGEYFKRLSRSSAQWFYMIFARPTLQLLSLFALMQWHAALILSWSTTSSIMTSRPETYVHRVGRAARQEGQGKFTFLKPSQMQAYNKLIDDVKINEKRSMI